MMEKNGNITENTPQSNGQTTHNPEELQNDLLYKASQAGCGCHGSCKAPQAFVKAVEADSVVPVQLLKSTTPPHNQD